MNILCENPCVTCDPIPLGAEGIFPNPNSEANPFSNFSSEAPDRNIFIGRSYPGILGDPPLGQPWTATGCIGVCLSFTSQEEADLCAARQQVICNPWKPNPQVPPGQPPDFCVTNPELCPPPNSPLFASSSQQCQFQCEDGSFFTFTTVTGLFLELNQQLANDKAYSWACQKAANNSLCFGSLSDTEACLGESFSSSVSVSSFGSRAVTFEVVSGMLPTGTFPSQSNTTTAVISGTPTMAGTYQFTLKATDTAGNAMFKNFTIIVVGIASTSPLTNGTIADPYSVVLAGIGPTAGANWQITGGSLPDGLTLNAATGEISGTPTTAGTSIFQVTMSL